MEPELLELEDVLEPFGKDVRRQADENLTANIAYVEAEMKLLGVSNPPTPELASQPSMNARGATADVQALAAQVARALEAQQKLRLITVAYESDQTLSGTEGGTNRAPAVTYDHDRPPSSMDGNYPGEAPVTPWIDVDRRWLMLEESIATAMARSPALFAILRDSSPSSQIKAAGGLAHDDADAATEKIRAALHQLSGDLERVSEKIGAVDWRDLLPVQQLVATQPQWQASLEQAVIADAISKARAREASAP